MSMPVTLNATACPQIMIPSTFRVIANGYTTSSSGGLVSKRIASGQYPWNQIPNGNALQADIAEETGGAGIYGVSLTDKTDAMQLVAPGSGLGLTIKAGTAQIGTAVQLATDAVFAVPNVPGRVWIWLGQDASIHAVTGGSLTPPVADCCLLGSVVVNGSGGISSVDASGVVYIRGGMGIRQTADGGPPTDTPPPNVAFVSVTTTGAYLWAGQFPDGTAGAYWPLAIPPAIGKATASVDGLVKTDVTNSDPVVYLKATVDTLLTAKIGTGASVAGILTGTVLAPTGIVPGAVTDAEGALSWKPAARLLATTNLTLTGAATVDGSAVATNDVVWATAQTTGSQNGPWVANTAGAWTRPTWWPTGGTSQAFANVVFLVTSGTVYGGTLWCMTTTGAVVIDTTAVAFAQVPEPSLAATAVTGGAYGDATHVGSFTVGSDGRLTAAANVAITGPTPVELAAHSITIAAGVEYKLVADFSAAGVFAADDRFGLKRATCSSGTGLLHCVEDLEPKTAGKIGLIVWLEPAGPTYYEQVTETFSLTVGMQGDGWTGGATTGVAATWTGPTAMTEPGKRAFTFQMAVALTPAAGADAAVFTVPFSPDTGASLQFTAKSFLPRLEQAGSTATSVKLERSTGTGAFSVANDLNSTAVTIPAADYEPTTPIVLDAPTLNSGDKVRINFTAAGTGADVFSASLTIEEA